MSHRMLRLRERLFGLAPWDAARITDEWFRAHFDYAADVVHQWMGSALDVRTARLLNFGCGDGITDLALVLRHGATAIHGVDIRREYTKLPRIAREQLGMARIPAALTFETIAPSAPLAGRHAGVDGIMSWSTFEHVQRDQLLPILRDLHACLRPGGVFFLQIEPLFYSPFGSHLRRYIETPWQHLLVPGEALWRAITGRRDVRNVTEPATESRLTISSMRPGVRSSRFKRRRNSADWSRMRLTTSRGPAGASSRVSSASNRWQQSAGAA